MTYDEFLDVLEEADRGFASGEYTSHQAFVMRVMAAVERWRSEVTETGD